MCVPSTVVRTPAHMAGAPARVAPNKRRVEAETGDQHAEQGQARGREVGQGVDETRQERHRSGQHAGDDLRHDQDPGDADAGLGDASSQLAVALQHGPQVPKHKLSLETRYKPKHK